MTFDDRWDLVVIGSGPGGQKAAVQGAKAGRRVLVIERAAAVGGACVHFGTIPSKTLRETAHTFAAFREKSGHVVDVSLPADVQIATLMTRLDRVVLAHERFIFDQLQRNGIEVWHGRARFVSPHAVEVLGVSGEVRRVEGRSIVIATGSRPRSPSHVPIDHEHIFDSDSLLAMRYLPRSITVLGAGVIATEYASIFSALGVAVTMIDGGARPLGFIDPEITACFTRAFAARGGRFVGGAKVTRVEHDGLGAVVTTLASGETIAAEKLLCALGRVANVEGLGLEAAGLSLDARGLLAVDEHYRTAVPHVYAVGDVIGPPSLASSSMEQGRRAACHAIGIPVGEASGTSPIGVYSIPEIAMVGVSEEEARRGGEDVFVGRARFHELARGQIAAAHDGLLKMVIGENGRELLGVQIVGEGAAELVHVGQMALIAKLPVDVFIDSGFNFPTLAEAYRVAALDVVGQRQSRAPASSARRAGRGPGVDVPANAAR